jgi:hypothetical protein
MKLASLLVIEELLLKRIDVLNALKENYGDCKTLIAVEMNELVHSLGDVTKELADKAKKADIEDAKP